MTGIELCSSLGWPVLFACCVSTACAAGEAAPREPARKVFAHYMLCFMAESKGGSHTGDGKVDGYLREIDAAHKAGLDGFALEALAWDKEPRYIHNADALFEACERYNKEQNADFKLFMIVNFCTSMDWDQARRIATRYLDRACYFHQDGKPMFSCWDGSSTKCGGPTAAGANKGWDENFIKPLAQAGHTFTFMPFVYPDKRREITLPNDAREIIAAMPVLNGHWYWGCSGLGDDIARSSGYNVKACRDAGILSAGPVSAPYSPHKQKGNNRYFPGMGAQSLADQWMGHITDQPDFVIFTTWNDLGEHHYVGPHYNVDTYPHGAYLELSAWFIRWYKSGKQPPIERDMLFYFYPTQPVDLECPKDPLGKPNLNQNAKYKVENCAYATVLLTAPASVEIVSGGKATTKELTAGMHHLSAPLAPGQQTFAIKRDGKTIVESTGGRTIETSAEAYNFETYSGFAAGK